MPILQHAKKGIIRFNDSPIDIPDHDSDDVGVHQAPNAGFAFLEVAIETRVLHGDRRRRGNQFEDGHSRGGKRVRCETVFEVQHPE